MTSRGARALPWALALFIVLAAGAAYLVGRRDGQEHRRAATLGTTEPDTAGEALGSGAVGGIAAGIAARPIVDQYVQYVAQHDAPTPRDVAEGVRRLAAALEAAAGRDIPIGVHADTMRAAANRLDRADARADDARVAFTAAAGALRAIDRARGATRDYAPLDAAAAALASDRPLATQPAATARCLAAARDLVAAMR